jgi:hypothetical protein
MFLATGGFSGCSDDNDDDNKEPVVEVKSGAQMQAMIVFAPGQLGDKGYADRVMDGINLIDTNQTGPDSTKVDLNFISLSNPIFTRRSMEQWLKNPVNGYTGQNYKRRLLVLTEPYMLDWLNEKSLRDSDEVLVLKAIGEDVDNYAGIGLGNRLHSLNISASISARRFSQFMDARIAREIERGYESRINKDMVTLLRLFSNEEVNYRDSLSETLEELRGDELELDDEKALSSLDNGGIYSTLFNEELIQGAYDCGKMLENDVRTGGIIFDIIDLGSANLGFDYYLMQQSGFTFTTLMLDARPNMLNRFCIDRRFDLAVSNWVARWAAQDLGTMPKAQSYSDEAHCQDNIMVE